MEKKQNVGLEEHKGEKIMTNAFSYSGWTHLNIFKT